MDANITVMVMRTRCWAWVAGWAAGGAGLAGVTAAAGAEVGAIDAVGAGVVGDRTGVGASVSPGSASAVAAGLGLTSLLQVR